MNMTQTYTNYLNMNMGTNVKMDKNMDKVREHVNATSNSNFVLVNSWLGEDWPQNKVCRLAQGAEKLQNRFFSPAVSMVNSQSLLRYDRDAQYHCCTHQGFKKSAGNKKKVGQQSIWDKTLSINQINWTKKTIKDKKNDEMTKQTTDITIVVATAI
jgi:hypothetical protein